MKIAIIRLSALGDIVHSMIVLQFLKQHYPNATVDWIVEERFCELLEHNHDINAILPINLKGIKSKKSSLLQEIQKILAYKKNSYDIIIDAQGLLKSAIVAKLLKNGSQVIGFDAKSTRESLAAFFYDTKVASKYEKNVILRNLDLLKPLNITVSHEEILNKKPFWDIRCIPSPIHEREYLLVVVGASKENKIYPKEHFVEVIKALAMPTYLLWGDEKERQTCEFIASQTDAKLTPKLSLNELKKVIANAALIIGGDTGPTHMAWGLNTPSITIYGNTPYWRNSFETPKNITIASSSKVNALKLDHSDFSIKNITPKEIITSIQKNF